MWHCTPLTVSTPFSEPRRPFLIVSPSRADRRGLAEMQASIDSRRDRSSWTTAAVPSTAVAFLVRRQQQGQRAVVIRQVGDKPLGSSHHGGHRRLHVRRPASEEPVRPVPSARTGRWSNDRPGRAGRRRRARPGRRAGRLTAVSSPEVPDGAAVDALAGKAGLRQPRGDQLQAAVVGGRDRTAARSAAWRAPASVDGSARSRRPSAWLRPAAAR